MVETVLVSSLSINNRSSFGQQVKLDALTMPGPLLVPKKMTTPSPYCWWKKSQTTTWEYLVSKLPINWCRIPSINSTKMFISLRCWRGRRPNLEHTHRSAVAVHQNSWGNVGNKGNCGTKTAGLTKNSFMPLAVERWLKQKHTTDNTHSKNHQPWNNWSCVKRIAPTKHHIYGTLGLQIWIDSSCFLKTKIVIQNPN